MFVTVSFLKLKMLRARIEIGGSMLASSATIKWRGEGGVGFILKGSGFLLFEFQY